MTKLSSFLVITWLAMGVGAAIIPDGSASAAPDDDAPASETPIPRDVIGRRAFAVVESNDLAAVARWVGGWNHLGDAIITPVLDDEESGAVAQQVATDHNA